MQSKKINRTGNLQHILKHSVSSTLALVIFLAVPVITYGQVGINVSTPEPKAILDLNDPGNNKGVLIPRLTTTEREALGSASDPAPDGMLVYDETQKIFYFWNAGLATPRWQALNPFTYRKGSGAIDEENFVISLTNNKSVVIGTVASPTRKLEVGGDIRATGDIAAATVTTSGDVTAGGKFVGFGTAPVGGIIMWSGDVADIPVDWALCDGGTYHGITTPNLSGRFIVGVGASTDGPTTYVMRTTGGKETHTLSVSEMPAHNHTGTTGSSGVHSHTYSRPDGGEGYVGAFNDSNEVYKWDNRGTYDTGDSGDHTHTIPSAGGGQAHENRPPYFVLAYIMRVQ